MKVGIVGGGGYVGSTLCRDLLNAGYKVSVMDNMHKGNVDNLIPLCMDDDFEFIEGDITSLNDCSKFLTTPDVVVNLAAIVGGPACARQPTLSRAVNVDGARNLTISKSHDQRLVFASTESVYGTSECVETSVPKPTSLYAKQKLQAEEEVLHGLNTVVFRFAAGMGLSYTTRINLLVNTLVYEAIKNNVLVIYQADVLRNFISVKDMSRCLQFGLFNKLTYNIYNAGSTSTTKRELAQNISKKTGCHLFFGDVAQDIDNRSLALNTNRLTEAGFIFQYNLEDVLDELVKGISLVNVRHNYD